MASLENKYRITQIGLVLSCQICTFKGLPVMSGACGPCCMFTSTHCCSLESPLWISESTHNKNT